MTNDYKKQIEKIKTPKNLEEQTKRLMKEALEKEKIIELPAKNQTKKKIKYQRLIKIVAVICLFAIPTFYFTQNQYTIEKIEVNELVISPKFGGKEQGKKVNNITVEKSDSDNIVPNFLKEVKNSKVKGTSIKIAKDQHDNYYATFQKGKVIYYVEGKDTNEKEFMKFIKSKV